MEKEIICISCPLGCPLKITSEGADIIGIEGYTCARGKEYARKEFENPERIFTSSVKTTGGAAQVVSVRSDKPIPKGLLMQCAHAVRGVEAPAPVRIHNVVLRNVLGTGVDIIATANVDRQ